MSSDRQISIDKRKKELLDAFKDAPDGTSTIVSHLINDMVFLETELEILRRVKHFAYNPANARQQEVFPSTKLYAQYISRYTDIVNKLCSVLRRADVEEESPLRAYLKAEAENGS